MRDTVINCKRLFQKKLQREAEQWDFYWINNLYPTHAVVKFLMWKSLCSLNKGWSTALHGQDTDLQGTSSTHELQTLMNYFCTCPWPCQECNVCWNQETCEAICCGSAFDHFPPSSCHSESNVACIYIFIHTQLSWIWATGEPCWEIACWTCSKQVHFLIANMRFGSCGCS